MDIATVENTRLHLHVANADARYLYFRSERRYTKSMHERVFLKESLSVSGGASFCNACREEVSFKRSVLASHINSMNKASSKNSLLILLV